MKVILMILFYALGVALWAAILIGYLAMIFSPFWLAKAALVAIGVSMFSFLVSIIFKRSV